jgi:hypothetical protein
VHVAPIRIEVDDRVAHDLSRTVVGDVAAAAGLVDLDTPGRQRVRRRQNMRAAAIAASPKRQHGRVLDEQQQIIDPPSLALGDK